MVYKSDSFYYKARIYHPKLGRFMQTDPIGYDDGMNMYAYVGNDPINLIDPTGRYGLDIQKIVSGSIDFIQGSVTTTGGIFLTGVGAIGILTPEPGTTLAGVVAVSVGTAAIPVGTNQMIDGLDQITEGITGEKPNSSNQKLTTVGDAVNSVSGTTSPNLGKSIDGVISKTVNDALPGSRALSTINNASTMNDVSKSLEPSKIGTRIRRKKDN